MFFPPYSPSSSQTEHSKVSKSELVKIGLGLSALLAMILAFNIEESLGLEKLMVVILGGFALYQLIPLAWRLQMLFLLTITGVLVLFEMSSALLILTLSSLLFVIVNARISVALRALILILISVFLAACRLHWLPFIKNDPALAVVGSLFMFRAILFLYEERINGEHPSIWLRLNYFFLLPNLVFLIFPIVDYKNFTHNFYSKPAYKNYRKGVIWMANGVLHFLLYRLVYYYCIPNPTEVESVLGWLQFAVASYALILRLAGIFHFSAGVICLFGFDLPPTFQHYFFADSFNDLWRRINRYWRDFVMKVFYYPIYFKIKHLGIVPGIIISILLSFVATWFLHAYQWLWVQGSILFTIQDITFWAFFGVAIAGNSAYVAAYRKKTLSKKKGFLVNASSKVLRVMGTFLFMSFLWSWWTATSPQQWWDFVQIWKTITIKDTFYLTAILMSVFGFGLLLYWWDQYSAKDPLHWRKNEELYLKMIIVIPLLLTFFAWSPMRKNLEDRFSINLQPVFRTELNTMDKDARFRGYYETMLDQRQILDTPLDQMRRKRPEDWTNLKETGAIQFHRTVLGKTLYPNLDVKFNKIPFTTNQFGLRDYPTDTIPVAGVLRMALLGASIEMGSGVRLEETFENRLTRKLNAAQFFSPFDSTEILNFAISGTQLLQHLARLEQIVPQFRPQVVICATQTSEARRISTYLHQLHIQGIDLEYPYLKKLIADLNLPPNVEYTRFARALRAQMLALLRWGYTHFKEQTEAIGAVPVFIFVPTFDEQESEDQENEIIRIAKETGLHVINLQGFGGENEEADLVVAEWDKHPNALGHCLLAEKIFEQLQKDKDLRQLIINQKRQ